MGYNLFDKMNRESSVEEIYARRYAGCVVFAVIMSRKGK